MSGGPSPRKQPRDKNPSADRSPVSEASAASSQRQMGASGDAAAASKAKTTKAAPPPMYATFFVLLKFMFLNLIAPTVFTAKSQRDGISRSAIFMVVFVVVHAAGNLTVLGGAEAFNMYGYHLHSLGLPVKIVEAYLLITTLMHALLGIYQTATNKFKKNETVKAVKGCKPQRATLILSGSILLVFLVVHVLTFRFGTWYTVVIEGVEVRDIYKLQEEVFKTGEHATAVVAGYCIAVLALAFHLWRGWAATVGSASLGLPGEHRPNAKLIGQVLTVGTSAGFMACPLGIRAGLL